MAIVISLTLFSSVAVASDPLQPPSNIVLTDIGLNSVNISWIKGPTANNTLIMGSRLEQPTSNNTGEIVYSGNLTSCVLTGVSLSIDNIKLSFWSELNGEYSPTYTTANIGGEDMEITLTSSEFTIAGLQQYIMMFIECILMIAFISFSFQHRDEIYIWIATGMVILLVAFDWWDYMLGLSVVLMGIAGYFFAWAVYESFRRHKKL